MTSKEKQSRPKIKLANSFQQCFIASHRVILAETVSCDLLLPDQSKSQIHFICYVQSESCPRWPNTYEQAYPQLGSYFQALFKLCVCECFVSWFRVSLSDRLASSGLLIILPLKMLKRNGSGILNMTGRNRYRWKKAELDGILYKIKLLFLKLQQSSELLDLEKQIVTNTHCSEITQAMPCT